VAVSLLLNAFQIPLFDCLTVPYIFVGFDGLTPDDAEYESNLWLLATSLSRKLRVPAAPVCRNGEDIIAIAAGTETIPDTIPLRGVLTRLRPETNSRQLRFTGGDSLEQDIAKKFVRWELAGSFYRDRAFFEHYGRQAERRAFTIEGYDGPISFHRTFAYGLVPAQDGRLDLAVDVGFCYVAKLPLSLFAAGNKLSDRRFERCLYKYGLDWYPVDISGPARRLYEIVFPHPRTRRLVKIREFLLEEWGRYRIPEIEALTDDDLALSYKNGNNQTRWAPAALLHPIYSTDTPEGAAVHRRAIMAPETRRRRIERAVMQVFSGRKLFGQPISLTPAMRRLPVVEAPLPKLSFGNDTQVSLTHEKLREAKWEALRAPGVGPHVTTPLDPQYALLPTSVPPDVRIHLLRSIDEELQRIYSRPYRPQLLTYDDTSPRLWEQLGNISGALTDKNGYALVVLPRQTHPKLYILLKRRLAEMKVQSQFARGDTMLRFFRPDLHGRWVLRGASVARYNSYIRYLSLGILAVNRKWLWRLADGTLSKPAYIGIDALKGTAVFTFVYSDASDIYFQIAKSGREERLSKDMMAALLLDRLPKDIQRLRLTGLSCIVIHRDGRLCMSERLALEHVANQLIRRELVSPTFAFKVLEVHKSSAYHPRLFLDHDGVTRNPRLGAYHFIGNREALVCTTGQPLLTQGTADPIYLVAVVGTLQRTDVEDFNALSHLGFTSPGACHRLALTLSLGDHILRERRPEAAEEQAWDDEVPAQEPQPFQAPQESA